MLRLGEVDAHCVAVHTLAAPTQLLAEESLSGYVMLLSDHFQGFCRDLYTECSQIIAATLPIPLQGTVQAQFFAELKLNSNNPTVETLRKDFERFAFTLNFHADPANAPRLTHLGHLNKWRNAVAHKKTSPPVGVPPLTLAAVQNWRNACDGLAMWLDGIMYAEVQRIIGAPPW